MPEQVARMLLDDVAEIGLATEALSAHDDLVTLPCYEWQHVLVVPAGHPLAAVERPTLEQLAAAAAGALPPHGDRPHAHRPGLRARTAATPMVALEAIDSDVIKTYVRLGLGVGIVAETGDDATSRADADLAWRPLGHLFGTNVTRVAFKRGAYLRQFVYAFAELLSPRLSPALIAARHGRPGHRLPTLTCRDTTPSRLHAHAHPRHHQPPAEGRHDDLHRDVGAGAGDRRRQPRARASPTSTATRPCWTTSPTPCARA